MKRNRRVAINLCVIAGLLFLLYYFGGFYISKNECLNECQRANLRKELESVMEIRGEKYNYAILSDMEDTEYAIVVMRRFGFLYRPSNFYQGKWSDEENEMLIKRRGIGAGEYQMELIYRNDKRVERVEAHLENGEIISLDNWSGDYVGYARDGSEFLDVTYKMYDVAGQFLGTVEY